MKRKAIITLLAVATLATFTAGCGKAADDEGNIEASEELEDEDEDEDDEDDNRQSRRKDKDDDEVEDEESEDEEDDDDDEASGNQEDWQVAFTDIIKEHEEKDPYFKYDFAYIDDDDIPELVCLNGSVMDMYKFDNGKVVQLTNAWAYGLGTCLEYGYSVADGYIAQEGHDSTGNYQSYMVWELQDDLTFEQTHNYTCIYYCDVNGDGKPESDEYSDEYADEANDVCYLDGETVITKEEYEDGLSDYSTGVFSEMSFDEAIDYLK